MLLLGGPNSFIRGMREAWQANIPQMWRERKVEIPEGAKPEELIKVPQTHSISRRSAQSSSEKTKTIMWAATVAPST